MAETEPKAPRNTVGEVLEGANTVVYVLVVLAIIVLANWFANNHDRRWDLTPTKQHSLSPQTLKLVKGLNRDVTLCVFGRRDEFRESRDLLNNYSSASRRVSLRYVDPDREPGLARQYGVRAPGTVVVAAGDRHYEAQSQTEEGITNALIHVLKGQKTVYFVSGHGEGNPQSTDRQGYSGVKKQLENENFQVKIINLLERNEVPADCSVLVIGGPEKDYQPQEVDSIKKYVAGGGRVLLMLDPPAGPRAQNPENLIKLLTDWNVTVENDLVIENGVRIMGSDLGMTVVREYGSSPIVQPVKDAGVMTLFPFTRSFTIGKESRVGVNDESLCETSSNSYGFVDFGPKTRNVAFRQGKDLKGPLTVGVAGHLIGTNGGSNSGVGTKEGRFVAFGTSGLAMNVYFGFEGNRDLFMGGVDWLASEEDLISIRPKPPEAQHLNMTQAQVSRILFLGVIGLPLVIVAAGILVWWGRR